MFGNFKHYTILLQHSYRSPSPEYCDDQDDISAKHVINVTKETFYELKDAFPFSVYKFQVKAVNNVFEGEFSEALVCQTEQGKFPSGLCLITYDY